MASITNQTAKVAKVKAKGAGSIPNKTIHSRASYLYQAATYLATLQEPHFKDTTLSEATKVKDALAPRPETQLQPASRRLVSELREVTLKAQIRMSPAMKQAICKNCDTLLIERSSCTSEIENKSRGGKKLWANMLARTCSTCGVVRRYPVGAERQKRRPRRTGQDSGDVTREIEG